MLDELHARHLIGVDDVRELWLVRHADAYSGLQALSRGRQDPVLSPQGRRQARLLAARLAPVRFDAVWSSDLLRASQTAEEVARGHGLPVQLDSRLREVRTHWDEGSSDVLGEPGVYPFPEPESEVFARMSEALAEIVAGLNAEGREPGRALVVSHNAAISVYVSSVLGLRWGQLRVMPQYTSVSVLAVKEEKVVVHSIADATHLAVELAEPD
jgi:probable phosphoglycerate mutase